MIISRVRVAILCVILAALASVSLVAQTRQTPAPPTPRPSPAPTIEQRFETPAPLPPPRIPDAERGLDRLEVLSIDRFSRPILRIGQNYTLREGDTVLDVRAVMADVRIDGHVTRDVVVVLGTATISSTAVIDGSLVVVGGDVVILPGATVGRDLAVVGGTVDAPPDFSPRGDHVIVGTPLLGRSVRALVPWLTRGLLWGRLIVPGLGWMWVIVGIAFLIGFALNHLFDRQVGASAAVLARKPLSTFLMGLLVLLLIGPILALVAASIIGLVVVPFAIAAVIVACLIGKVGVTRAIGRSVVPVGDPESRLQSWRSFTIGFGVITLAYMVPILGLLTWALVGVFGLGAATMSFAATLRREHPAPPRVPPVAAPPVVPAAFVPPVEGAAMASPASSPPDAAFVAAPGPGDAPASAPAFVAAEPARPAPPIAPSIAPDGRRDLSWYPRASFLDRLAGFALDCVLVAIGNAMLLPPHRGGGPFLLILLIYFIAFWAWRGTTLGGIIVGLRVVRMNGAPLRFADALVRGLSSIFSVFALGIGCFWMLSDAERQTWHDKIAGTVVVKLPRELVLD